MANLELNWTIRISFLSFASFQFHCIVRSTQQFLDLFNFRCPVVVEWSPWMSLSWHLSTTTITADVECLNVLLDLFMRFDAKDYTLDRLKQIEHLSSIPIKFQLLSVLLVCVADATECLVMSHRICRMFWIWKTITWRLISVVLRRSPSLSPSLPLPLLLSLTLSKLISMPRR